MIKIKNGQELLKFGEKFKGYGMLISGGFDREGGLINLDKMIEVIKKLREKFFIAIHPGFVDEKMANELYEACDIAFVDLPSDNAIKNVLNMEKSSTDYFMNMARLIDAGIEVTPHITIGLNYGKVEEWKIIDDLKNYKIRKVVINIIMPTPKTPFENVKVKKDDVLNFIDYSKNFNFSIGCMRPRKFDVDLVKHGVKEIAVPSKKAMETAKKVEIRNFCCGLQKI
ncbi:MAG: radical SAM protein [Thermoplasmatales archaeon]|nr:radical SAM protein [Thermoplasmatales archaeon]